MHKSRFKALALFSGGLDSILAVKVIQLQNIQVEGIIFESPFFKTKDLPNRAELLGIKFHSIDITEDLIKIIENPKYGFGKNLNPCIDCHLLMIKKAGDLLKRFNADFIITGEVAGERPKSQNYKALNLIAQESGYKDRLLRPLSAKRLPVTEIEEKSIVDREKLFGISGKNRTPQIQLAKKFDITYYPQPAGGCLLTVPRFADRLRISLKQKKITSQTLELLKYGRHFLTEDGVKIIIGRDKEDNKHLMNALKDDYPIFELADALGPIGVLCQLEPLKDNILITAQLLIRYSKLRDEKKVRIKYYKNSQDPQFLITSGKDHEALKLTHI